MDDPSLARLDVAQLRWFVAVADELHFARAAKSLNIARQKLSNAVIDLETQLGVKLFVPGSQPTELTDDGRELRARASAIIAEDDERTRFLAEAAAAPKRLRIAFVSGVTVSKWTRIWDERFPAIALDVDPIAAIDQTAVLSADADIAFVRFPIDADGLSAIPLYEEVPVVVVPKEHPVSAFDQVAMADLADEQIHDASDLDNVTGAIELVAAGVGVVIVPHSIARLHARKDLVFRTVTDADPTRIALAWRTDALSEQVEEFIGIVRGRSAHSSRSQATQPEKKPKRPAKKAQSNKEQAKKEQPRKKAQRRRR
ncbi:LysR family transcriptional regulator [Antrihabitans cavernicola]|uniref:LysR family transcriptional regulator n=1 Tax=Antrihabitans cavernicola TaxID=2495913 RepID=A0A5A7SEN4_9NOCA|nr:LysR substrate-binding domain-containing protein [Spelaeibacter cavernicola]KAA0022691.1 LysR family transcriptional regulator [Spelaeibacter cavernicola]